MVKYCIKYTQNTIKINALGTKRDPFFVGETTIKNGNCVRTHSYFVAVTVLYVAISAEPLLFFWLLLPTAVSFLQPQMTRAFRWIIVNMIKGCAAVTLSNRSTSTPDPPPYSIAQCTRPPPFIVNALICDPYMQILTVFVRCVLYREGKTGKGNTFLVVSKIPLDSAWLNGQKSRHL